MKILPLICLVLFSCTQLSAVKIPKEALKLNNRAARLVHTDPSKARKLYFEALEITPDFPAAYIGLMTIEINERNHVKAIEYSHIIERLQPTNESIVLSLGMLYDAIEKSDLAKRYFNKAKEMNKNELKNSKQKLYQLSNIALINYILGEKKKYNLMINDIKKQKDGENYSWPIEVAIQKYEASKSTRICKLFNYCD